MAETRNSPNGPPDAGGPNDEQPVLKDVVALVEVRTRTENRSRGVEYQLEQLGAKVVSKLTPEVTHVIWKNGKKPTLERARKKGIHVVTVLWVESCKQNQERVAESLFPVINKDHGSPLFVPTNRRRKFMEPTDLEEDIRGSRERLAKRRKKDLPSPITLPGRVLVKDTPHRQSPTWFLPGPPFSPSLIPHTPDSMRKCLDHLSAAKSKTPSNRDRPSLGASPTCGAFDSPTSEKSSPLERPQVVGSLIERLLYSDNEEPSPLERVSKNYDAAKKNTAEEKRPSLSKTLFPAAATEQAEIRLSLSSEKTGRPATEVSKDGGQEGGSDGDESRRSSHISQSSTEARSSEVEEAVAAQAVPTKDAASNLSRKRSGKNPGGGRSSRGASCVHSTGSFGEGSSDQEQVENLEGARSKRSKPGNAGGGVGARRKSRINPKTSQSRSSGAAVENISDPTRCGSGNKSLEVTEGQKSRLSSRLSRGVIQVNSSGGGENVESPDGLRKPILHVSHSSEDRERGIRDITNSPRASLEAGIRNGKIEKSREGSRQLSRKSKKKRNPGTEVLETVLLESSPEDVVTGGKKDSGVDDKYREEGRQLSRRSTRRSSRMEEVETIILESSPEEQVLAEPTSGLSSGDSSARGGCRSDEGDGGSGRGNDLEGYKETGSSSSVKKFQNVTGRKRGTSKKSIRATKSPNLGKTLTDQVKLARKVEGGTDQDSREQAGMDDVERKLSGTPGQKRLMAENDGGEEEMPKRRQKRRKLLKMSQTYEDPPSVLIEPREARKRGQDEDPAEDVDVSSGRMASHGGTPGRKVGKRLSSRLKKDVNRGSQSEDTGKLAKPDRTSLDDFRVSKRRSTTMAASTDSLSVKDMGNPDASQQLAGIKGSTATTAVKTKGHTGGSKISSKKPTIVMTSMHKSEQEIVVSVIRNLGGFKITDTVGQGTTHVVTGDNRRTLNVLYAIAHGVWLVSKEWVLNSLETGHWLSEEPFEVHNTFPAARLSRQLKGQSVEGSQHLDLFWECGEIFVNETSSPPRERLCELISLCGGSISKTQRPADLCVGACSSRPEVPVVKEKWVLDCISEMKSLPMDDYRMANS